MLHTNKISFNELYLKYNVKGSFYTAYPPTGQWLEQFSDSDYRQALTSFFAHTHNMPIQLYVHFPYCVQQCYYCQCFQFATKDKRRIKDMLEAITSEARLMAEFFAMIAVVPQFNAIHLGGGSPSYLEVEEFDELITALSGLVAIDLLEEFAIEIDPRTVSKEKLQHYHSKGINRISFGVQELDPVIQKTINRIQPIEKIEELLELRSLFKGVNFDLIYGLPLQTCESLHKTLKKVIELSPDRISFSVLGYRPDVFKHSQKIKESELPTVFDRTRMWEESRALFLQSGYEQIGMDHFAKPEDELAIAKNNNNLFRNMMGYSPGKFHDTLSIGPSGMSQISSFYFQNTYSIPDYCQQVKSGIIPVFRGYSLNNDDVIRREIINEFMKYFRIDLNIFKTKYETSFATYFRNEMPEIDSFVQDGILEITADSITVTPLGRFFLRNVSMVFDNLGLEYRHNVESGIDEKS